jgi:hypothetical protein
MLNAEDDATFMDLEDRGFPFAVAPVENQQASAGAQPQNMRQIMRLRLRKLDGLSSREIVTDKEALGR